MNKNVIDEILKEGQDGMLEIKEQNALNENSDEVDIDKLDTIKVGLTRNYKPGSSNNMVTLDPSEKMKEAKQPQYLSNVREADEYEHKDTFTTEDENR